MYVSETNRVKSEHGIKKKKKNDKRQVDQWGEYVNKFIDLKSGIKR